MCSARFTAELPSSSLRPTTLANVIGSLRRKSRVQPGWIAPSTMRAQSDLRRQASCPAGHLARAGRAPLCRPSARRRCSRPASGRPTSSFDRDPGHATCRSGTTCRRRSLRRLPRSSGSPSWTASTEPRPGAAARATASSPCDWAMRVKPVGARISGIAAGRPKIVVDVSRLLTSRRIRGWNSKRANADELRASERSSSAPPSM